MDTDKIERLRERLLQCAVCMEEYKDPRILPCHHTYCFECITSVVQSSSSSGRFFRCPQCRIDTCVPKGGVGDLPINFYIISLQDELGTKGYTEICSVCKRDWLVSQFRCIDCDIDICRFCIHEHRLETHFIPPKILRIETTANDIQLALASNHICSEHADGILQMFCITCNKAICITCSCSNHKLHNVVPINVKLQESKKYLQSELDRLTSEKRNALKAVEDIMKIEEEVVEVSNRAMLALDEAAHKACALIMKKKFELEKEILGSEKKQKESLGDVLTDFQSYIQRLDRGLAFLSDLQDNDICMEVVDTYKEFSLKLNASRKICTENHVEIQHPNFSLSQFAQISSVNLGLFRELFYLGKLGTLSRKNFCLSVNQKTIIMQKKPSGLIHNVDSIYYKRFLQFLVAFFVWQMLFYVGDVSGVFDRLLEFTSIIFTQLIFFISEFF